MRASRCLANLARPALGPVQYSYIPHLVPYSLGLALQEHLVARRADARAVLRSPSASSTPSEDLEKAKRTAASDTLLLLQHKPVYTEGRREAQENESEARRLRALGADYEVTKRGGMVTFHGPGQLVGYPIWDLGAMQLSTRCYVDRLQTALQSVLHQAPYGINTVPPPHDHTGVWVDSDHKIASIGIQVRHRITSHGFALNIEAQVLDWFRHIVACGIVGKGMTAIERELALRVRDEELARPDLEASYAEHARRDAAAANATAAAAVDANTSSTATEIKTEAETVSKRNAPHFDHLEPEMLLVGPESRVSVETVAPRLVEALGTTFARQMVPAPEDQLRYEADSRGLLNKVWVDGKELKL